MAGSGVKCDQLNDRIRSGMQPIGVLGGGGCGPCLAISLGSWFSFAYRHIYAMTSLHALRRIHPSDSVRSHRLICWMAGSGVEWPMPAVTVVLNTATDWLNGWIGSWMTNASDDGNVESTRLGSWIANMRGVRELETRWSYFDRALTAKGKLNWMVHR